MARDWPLFTREPLARHIRRRPGSTTWIRVFRARWLALGSKNGTLSIWDLRALNQEPILEWSLDGCPESGLLLSSGDGLDRLVVNTNTFQTYNLAINLGQLERDDKAHPFIYEDRRLPTGFSGLLAAQGGSILAFARRASVNLPHLYDISSGVTICLGRAPEVSPSQYCLAIAFHPDFVVVAKDLTVEVYSAEILQHLRAPAGQGTATLTVEPLQALHHPIEQQNWMQNFPHTVHLIDPHPDGSLGRAVMGVSVNFRHVVQHWSLEIVDQVAEESEHKVDVLQPKLHFATRKLNRVELLDHHKVTESHSHHLRPSSCGRYYIWFQRGSIENELVYPEASLFGLAIRSSNEAGPPRETPCRKLWTAPSALCDEPSFVDFDADVGLVAIAMASGLVWIVDFTSDMLQNADPSTTPEAEIATRPSYRIGLLQCSDEDPLNPVQDEYLFPEDSNEGEKEEWIGVSRLIEPEDPLPMPAPWHPFSIGIPDKGRLDPAVFQSWPRIPFKLPPKWTDKRDSSCIGREFENAYYGQKQWFFNKVLHIPGTPIPLLRRIDDPDIIWVVIDGTYWLISEDLWGDEKYSRFSYNSLEDLLQALNENPDHPEGLVETRNYLTGFDLEAYAEGNMALGLRRECFMRVWKKSMPGPPPYSDSVSNWVDSGLL